MPGRITNTMETMKPPPAAAESDAEPPVYKSGEVPEPLLTMTQLKARRLKPAEGQEVKGLLRMYRRGSGWGVFDLYDPAGAVAMRPLSAKQEAAKTARRTCPECGEVRGYVVYGRCAECRQAADAAAQELQARTCRWCHRVSGTPLPGDGRHWRMCDPCRIAGAIRDQVEEERLAVWARTCPGHRGFRCAEVTATDEEIAAAKRTGWVPRRCPPCGTAREEEVLEEARQAEEDARLAQEARHREVERLVAWAQEALADDSVVVLDTETTGLGDDARIVDIAVTDRHGAVLLDTLVDPRAPIPAEATDIHGITDAMVAGAPTFPEVLERLSEVLAGRHCLIYNAGYDIGRLRHELILHHLDRAARERAGQVWPAKAAAGSGGGKEEALAAARHQADAWLGSMVFEDIMIPYSDWCGDWSDYWGNYQWQPLYGGDHRALSDCRAALRQLAEMVERVEPARDPWATGAVPAARPL